VGPIGRRSSFVVRRSSLGSGSGGGQSRVSGDEFLSMSRHRPKDQYQRPSPTPRPVPFPLVSSVLILRRPSLLNSRRTIPLPSPPIITYTIKHSNTKRKQEAGDTANASRNQEVHGHRSVHEVQGRVLGIIPTRIPPPPPFRSVVHVAVLLLYPLRIDQSHDDARHARIIAQLRRGGGGVQSMVGDIRQFTDGHTGRRELQAISHG
jgi:hypothetical protein